LKKNKKIDRVLLLVELVVESVLLSLNCIKYWREPSQPIDDGSDVGASVEDATKSRSLSLNDLLGMLVRLVPAGAALMRDKCQDGQGLAEVQTGRQCPEISVCLIQLVVSRSLASMPDDILDLAAF
jgi:hypothetical protein